MDEPTNHLDIEGILWLERLLRAEASRLSRRQPRSTRFLEAGDDRVMIARSIAVIPPGYLKPKGTTAISWSSGTPRCMRKPTMKRHWPIGVRREVEWLRRGPKARTDKSQIADRLRRPLRSRSWNSADARRKDQGTAGINFTASGRRSKTIGRGHATLQIARRAGRS